MINFWKKYYIWISLFIILFFIGSFFLPKPQINIGAKDLTQAQVDAKITELLDNQTDFYRLYKKYQHINKTTLQNLTFEVDEFQMPSGNVGYEVKLWLVTDGDTFQKVIASGTELTTTNWVLIPGWIASTTP